MALFRRKMLPQLRTFATKSNNFVVTTPIYYVNAKPHIGHLYSSVLADAITRWNRILNPKIATKLFTGTDEHGSKIQAAAFGQKKAPLEYCNSISSEYVNLAKTFSVNYSDFIRTTCENHKKCVAEFWQILQNKGFIYSDNYKGWYCVSDETFLNDLQVKEITKSDGSKSMISLESGHLVEWTQEKNYLFKLSLFQEKLIKWLEQNKVVRPDKFQKILLDLLTKNELPDLSISRPKTRVFWGIEVPNDDSQTVYVWLDALANYLTTSGFNTEKFGENWPPNVQVIGKDILKFHGVYWPAFLMAADLELPQNILCHSHWTVDNEKMSKSKNNVVCPIEKSQICTSDGLRFFLLREGVPHSDGNFSNTKLIRVVNSELADTLGNLLSRCTAKTLNPSQKIPKICPKSLENIVKNEVAQKLVQNLTNLPEICLQNYNDYNFYKSIDAIIATLHSANLFFETFKPWEIKKNTSDTKKLELDTILRITMETLRISAILLQPIVPNLAENILEKLNVPKNERFFENVKNVNLKNENFVIEKNLGLNTNVLFKRIIVDDNLKKVKQKN